MYGIREKLIQFMTGRYGIDQLYYGLLVLYFVLLIINFFIPSIIASIVLTVFCWSVFLYMFFRVFSRNLSKRYAENQMFLSIWNPIAAWFRLLRNRIRDRKTKVYHKCPNCKAVLRLPRRKGVHTVQCPKCKADFRLKVRF